MRGALGMAALWVWPVATVACPLRTADGARVAASEGAVQLAWRTQPRRIKMGEPFVLHVAVCPKGAVLTAVDATMPEHQHGMNYQPALQAAGPGRWRAEGLLWHMRGSWEWRFDVQAPGGGTQSLRQRVALP